MNQYYYESRAKRRSAMQAEGMRSRLITAPMHPGWDCSTGWDCFSKPSRVCRMAGKPATSKPAYQVCRPASEEEVSGVKCQAAKCLKSAE
jgi:hypothetical protein